MSIRSLLLPIALLLLSATLARADEPAQPWYKRLSIHGFADVYYSYNFNAPADGANFLPGVGTSGKRHNEFSLNLGVVEMNLDPEPVGARLVLGYGTGTEVLHGGEPAAGARDDGAGVGREAWRFLQEASISVKIPVGNGLVITGGVFPSHIGFEVMASKDNWNYTRSWVADLAPFYQTGIRLAYPITSHVSAQLHVLNGWQLIVDNNAAKTLGAQLMWSSDRVTASWNLLAGPELPGDNTHWRVLNDFYLILRPAGWISLAAVGDIGLQQQIDNTQALWYGAELFVQSLPQPWLALALRGGLFLDQKGAISGTAQTLYEGTATVELKPMPGLAVKLEGRYDHSTADVFSTGARDADGAPQKTDHQVLCLLGGVVSF